MIVPGFKSTKFSVFPRTRSKHRLTEDMLQNVAKRNMEEKASRGWDERRATGWKQSLANVGNRIEVSGGRKSKALWHGEIIVAGLLLMTTSRNTIAIHLLILI